MRSRDKDNNIIITLPVFNIMIVLNDDVNQNSRVGSITSDIKEHEDNDADEELYNAAIDGVTSIILGHAIAGVDVESDEYVEGIADAVHACANNF
jgi:hypothetical protein